MKIKQLRRVLIGGLIIALAFLLLVRLPVVRMMVRASFLVFILAILVLIVYLLIRGNKSDQK